jgi:hypothetical protein
MPSRSELTLCSVLFLLSCPAPIFADKLQITSNPSGATVELDGVAVGATPFEKEFPGHADWRRTLEVLKSSKVSLKATLEPGS